MIGLTNIQLLLLQYICIKSIYLCWLDHKSFKMYCPLWIKACGEICWLKLLICKRASGEFISITCLRIIIINMSFPGGHLCSALTFFNLTDGVEVWLEKRTIMLFIWLQGNTDHCYHMKSLVPEAGISGKDKYLQPTVFCGMQLLIFSWDTCFGTKVLISGQPLSQHPVV